MAEVELAQEVGQITQGSWKGTEGLCQSLSLNRVWPKRPPSYFQGPFVLVIEQRSPSVGPTKETQHSHPDLSTGPQDT